MNKPFLKWAGSKRKILKQIKKRIGIVNGRFIEPFVGSGTVFMNTIAESYLLGDLNEDLINIFTILHNEGMEFVDFVEDTYFKDEFNDSDVYYVMREKFNSTEDKFERAALFMYLNRHTFNGLCRYNKSGDFNVPFGKYDTIYFPRLELEYFIGTLDAPHTFLCQGFEETMLMAEESDVIYCDPPYVPISATSSFTSYCSDGFELEDQKLLAKLAEESKAKVIISNNFTDVTQELYKNASKIVEIYVQKSIGSKGDSRKKTKEIIAVYN